MRLFFVSSMLLLALAAPAYAGAAFPCADNSTSCDPYSIDTTDSTNWNSGGGSGTWLGGDYITCTAVPGQYCFEKKETWNSTTQTWEKRCARVTYTAKCGCNTKTFEERGLCTYKG